MPTSLIDPILFLPVLLKMRHSWSRMDIRTVCEAVWFYFKHSLAPSTREFYTRGVDTTLPTILQPCQSPTTTHLRINTTTVFHTSSTATLIFKYVPRRLTLQLCTNNTCKVTTSKHTPPSLLLEFRKCYMASNNIRPVCLYFHQHKDWQSPSPNLRNYTAGFTPLSQYYHIIW